MRKLVAIAMSLILLVSLSVSASAAAARAFLLQEYDVMNDAVYCYGKQLPPDGNIEVSVGSRIIKDVSLSTLEKENIPVTVYCLVDSATSLSDKMVQHRQDLLLTISSLMGSNDSMVLATIDSVLTESKPMDSKEVRDTAIQTIAGQAWYTNLYDGISAALKTLQVSTSYNTNRCLVIISDGHDDGKSTAKGDTILKQINEAGIPVYTVILSSKNASEKELTLQNQFAEESLGGFLSFPDRDSISGSAAGQRIWDSIKGAAAIRIGAEELQESGTDQQLLIRYDAANTRYEDSILIRTVDLRVPVTESPAETTDSEENAVQEDSPSAGLLACGIGIALLGIGAAAFFLLRKKTDHSGNIADIANIASDLSTDSAPPIDPQSSGMITDCVTMPVQNRCHVSAVAIMHPEVAVDFYLTPNMESTFGRTEKADIVLNSRDQRLSGCHGAFFWDGTMLLVQDRHSTNGTAVNGEICSKDVWLRIEDGATLTVGKYEYRITYNVE